MDIEGILTRDKWRHIPPPGERHDVMELLVVLDVGIEVVVVEVMVMLVEVVFLNEVMVMVETEAEVMV